MSELDRCVDVVPVVRCKDCVCSSMLNDEMFCVLRRETTDRYYLGRAEMVNPNDYCNRGIRRMEQKHEHAGGAENAAD